MREAFAARKLARPQISAQEFTDMLVYLQNLPETRASRLAALDGAADVGPDRLPEFVVTPAVALSFQVPPSAARLSGAAWTMPGCWSALLDGVLHVAAAASRDHDIARDGK
jgi:hypothetical protein